jgi:hypothetical protein
MVNFPLSNVSRLILVSKTFDPAEIAANTSANNATTLTVTGVAVGDMVIAFKPTTNAGMAVLDARVSAANTIQVVLGNFTGSGIDPGSETWTFLIIRPSTSSLPDNVS